MNKNEGYNISAIPVASEKQIKIQIETIKSEFMYIKLSPGECREFIEILSDEINKLQK